MVAAQLARSADIEEAMRAGSAAAALCVGRTGAQPSIPTREETLNLLNPAQ